MIDWLTQNWINLAVAYVEYTTLPLYFVLCLHYKRKVYDVTVACSAVSPFRTVACLLAALAGWVMPLAVSARLFFSFEPTNFFTLIFCLCMDHDDRSPGIESRGAIIKGWHTNVCASATRVFTAYDGRSSRFPFWRHHLRASVAKASISGGVQREWVW